MTITHSAEAAGLDPRAQAQTGIGGRRLAALAALWDRLRQRHPDVPPVVITLATETSGRRGPCQQGRFRPDRWQHGDTLLPELALHTSVLAGDARDVLEVMAHHAVHAIALTREISVTSRGGAYHNGRYRQLANELDLTTTRDDRGWALTTLSDTAAEHYRDQLDTLTTQLDSHQPRDLDNTEDHGAETALPGPPHNGYALTCSCVPPRRLRAAQRTIDTGPILCGICHHPFTIDTQER